MTVSALGGSRRSKLLLIAAVQVAVIFYLGYWYSPLILGSGTIPDIPEWYKTTLPSQDIEVPVDDVPVNDTPINETPANTVPVDDDHDYYPPSAPATPDIDDELDSRPPPTWPPPTSDSTTTEDIVAEPETTQVACASFDLLQATRPEPLSTGWRKFPLVRPPPRCRTFQLPAMEALIDKMRDVIADPDLFRLFENSYPNTLDTMVKWRGYANKTDEETGDVTVTDEELAYIITGDIDAMWLRDSASQIYSYVSLLEPSEDPDSLASLWRGLINSHARYIIISPYCHSFQPPPESGIPPSINGAYSLNHPQPGYDPELVFDCKWELDSLASFLQISTAYYERTGDLAFFGKYSWVEAVEAAVDAAGAMRLGTYDEEGHVLPSAWTFTGYTNRGSETLTNDGLGNPVRENGMVRSGFRPSDDACIFQLLTPSNMMFAAYLEHASVIMEGLSAGNLAAANLTGAMRELAATIRTGIARDAVVPHRDFGDIFAFEVDGYGGANLMDDANVPSLLALPLWNFTRSKAGSSLLKSLKDNNGQANKTKTELAAEAEEKKRDYAAIYQNTRRFVLSTANPYYAKGPVLSAIGGPHLGPGKGWPMAATVAALTAFDDLAGLNATARDAVVAEQLRMVLDSTNGKGVIHETVNAWSEYDWTRSWFGWANGLFGELILKIADEEKNEGGLGKGEGLLGRLWQDKPKGRKEAETVSGTL